jgi:UDP-glucuronate 4-epimerase
MKQANLDALRVYPRFRFLELDILDSSTVNRECAVEYNGIVHLAAKAGVRPSIAEPMTYQKVNVIGTQCLLDFAREHRIKQFVFASSSSVYGVNPSVPWRETESILQPISPYAATKISGELLGAVYSHLYGIRFLALRFFTVYGPSQRPDLAIRKFAEQMLAGVPIPVYGEGTTSRDYTYVDDIVCGITAALDYDLSLYEVMNLGNEQPIQLNELVRALEASLGVKAIRRHMPLQAGDVPRTCADISKARRLLAYKPHTTLSEGLHKFSGWLRQQNAFAAVSR